MSADYAAAGTAIGFVAGNAFATGCTYLSGGTPAIPCTVGGLAVGQATEAAHEDTTREPGPQGEEVVVRLSADQTVLAYKGMDGVPLWVLFGIAILGFIAFGVAQARKRK
ncbi:hypothetical protein AB0F03_31945 [Streptomyces sp. NPDC028722]|uniref:hypothetical protein n=1 Tax=Streptomyces sp. NPDC028722 TaxID=3155016 RepID=UPI003404AB14